MSKKIVHYHQTEPTPVHAIGRNRLQEWHQAQPTNYFTADTDLQRKLELYLGPERYRAAAPRLYKFGQTAATLIDPLVRESEHPHNRPVLQRYDSLGQRVEQVQYHPAHHQVGRLIYGSGLTSVLGDLGQNKLALALFYLSAMNGEAGHHYGVVCTASAIKTMQRLVPDYIRQQYLPRLLDENYEANYTGAQYFAEIQGGSDIGANGVTARPEDTDSQVWYLNGEKWFCAPVTAEVALVSARMGEAEGTAGLGLFLVPRYVEEDQLNGVYIRRLKEMLGTRSLATAEVDLRDAQGHHIGNFQEGIQHVIHTSRIYNAFAYAGHARRALIIAWSYAHNRLAFGQLLARFPIVQDQLAKMRADCAAVLAGSMRIAKVWDEMELGKGTADDRRFWRVALNLTHYRSAVLAREVLTSAIELLGSNGTIEDFSALPRLWRDHLAYEQLTGTHNAILAQLQQEMRRDASHQPFGAVIRQLFEATTFDELKREGLHRLDGLEDELRQVLEMDELTAGIYFRPLMDRFTDLYYAACMAAESGWEQREKEDKTKQRLAIFFLNRRVALLQPGEITYYDDQVSRLSSAM